MDIPRHPPTGWKRARRPALATGALLLAILAGIGLYYLKPAPPTVNRSEVWIGEVSRGTLVLQVRGAGSLVPENVRWIPASTGGRVERVEAQPGTPVDSGTVILEMSNPELLVEAQEAEWELRAAVADLENLQVQLESGLLSRRADATAAEADHHQARLRLEADSKLAEEGLVAPLELELSEVRVRELAQKAEIENRRLQIADDATRAQVAAQRAKVDRLRGIHHLKEEQVASLTVRAGLDGVLQDVLVEAGQRVATGTNLARVADPGSLKAEIRIPETRARDVRVGQAASIDTRNELVEGRVRRIDPAVQNGTVTVDVELEGPLPRGARPDLTVSGTIELDRLEDVLYVGRPALARDESTVGLFRLTGDDGIAVRVPVTLGRSSVNFIEVRKGLEEGERVVLSDTSRWDAFDRIRVN